MKENNQINTKSISSLSLDNQVNINNNSQFTPDQLEMLAILQSVNMGDYLGRIIDNGFDDLDTFLELNLEHMQTIDIPLG